MRFVKMQGAGNDFILINGLKEKSPSNLLDVASNLCDRHFGIGADGLIIILPSEIADIKMCIINSDGSEAEMCGNGIRCFARYVYEEGIVKKEVFKVETLAGIMSPHLILEKGKVVGVTVDMGEPSLEGSSVPILGFVGQVINEPLKVLDTTFKITALLMGVPHCVVFVDDVSNLDVAKYGAAIETNPVFPRKSNVHFLEIINEREIEMRVWERGAGLTLACGTGACASLVASVLNKKTGRKAKMNLPGGTLYIEWANNNHVYMTGPAKRTFSGEIQDSVLFELN
ncbi:MAG: diaminopimelate epimerase [Clostridia bacterium]|nr:diaminopimelate epimerase [Clostridia bacterium]MDD4048667.1 diaminopimelate epimerase [Clostridia bacterium]